MALHGETARATSYDQETATLLCNFRSTLDDCVQRAGRRHLDKLDARERGGQLWATRLALRISVASPSDAVRSLGLQAEVC